jgi:ribosome-associated protein
MGPEKLAKIAVAALEDIKGRDIVVFNVKKMTALFDKVIIVSGDSNRQLRALANNVCEEVKKAGGSVLSTEGEQTGEWVLVDLGRECSAATVGRNGNAVPCGAGD